MSDRPMPPYVTPAQVAKACGWTRRVAFRKLQKLGLAHHDGERWQVTTDQLRELAGPIYARVYAHICLQAGGDRRRPTTARDGRPQALKDQGKGFG